MCKCRERIDAELAKTNQRLAVGFTVRLIPRKGEMAKATLTLGPPMIVTEKIDKSKRGKKPTLLLATYCPFCGEKYRGD